MSKIDYQALREASQNYQSTLAWYQENPDSPNAERDCDAALSAFKREIRHREVDIIADLLDELEEAKQRIDEQ
ncbi:TPA: ead/Ea22-like family protein, partial [Escherichia coli]|nr:ead/Ea22-like family protein [Escherichia coli]HEA8612827.1 ead/Ea22-like family protein [Escherichia coli]